MKLTCMVMVAVLFFTPWTFAPADDPRNGLENLFPKAPPEMKNPEAFKLNKRGPNTGELCDGVEQNCRYPYCFIVVCL
uniref:Conotoxin Mr14.2 n=1 Tax=Conus marmoreus TaxID=42752 RepID=M9PM84_CONMR|nr:conotoxin Mr14.2 [Conus marmoreus]